MDPDYENLEGTKAESCAKKAQHIGICKFSELLTTPCVTICVGSSEDKKQFFLHEGLLFHESKKFRRQFQGGFSETTTRTLPDFEEDVELFRFFVEYLYRDGWVSSEGINHESEYINLARMYSMGERLHAKHFQQAVLWKFSASFSGSSISDQGICDLLEIVCTELPERLDENFLQTSVFWYAAKRLSTLKKYVGFQQMLKDIPDLARYLCLRSGDGPSTPPSNNTKRRTRRFQAEGNVNPVLSQSGSGLEF